MSGENATGENCASGSGNQCSRGSYTKSVVLVRSAPLQAYLNSSGYVYALGQGYGYKGFISRSPT